MTFTLNYTNTIQDYAQANHYHSGSSSHGLRLLLFLFLCIWFLKWIFATPAPIPLAPAPTLQEILVTLAIDAIPWVGAAGILAIIFSAKPKPPKRSPLSLKPVAPKKVFMDAIPTFILLSLAGCFLLSYILIALFLDLAHRDGSAPAFYEFPLRILPWAFIAFFLWTALVRRGIKITWLKQTHLQLPQTLTFSDDSVTIHNSNVHSIYQWHAFNQCRETPDLFMLYISGLSFIMLPKRALASPQELDAFRAFLDSHIVPPSSAFPILPITRPIVPPQ